MINLYIVDYFSIGWANGLSTYVNTLTTGITSHIEINLHYIWINSTGYKCFDKVIVEDCVHYYIPRHISDPNEASDNDLKVAGFLTKDMVYQQNVIVHFNYNISS